MRAMPGPRLEEIQEKALAVLSQIHGQAARGGTLHWIRAPLHFENASVVVENRLGRHARIERHFMFQIA